MLMLKKYAFFLTLIVALLVSCSEKIPQNTSDTAPQEVMQNTSRAPQIEVVTQTIPGIDVDSSTLSSDLYFIPDEGYRIDHASRVEVILDNETGDIYIIHGVSLGDDEFHPDVVSVSKDDGMTFEEVGEYTSTFAISRNFKMKITDENGETYWKMFKIASDGIATDRTYDEEIFRPEKGLRYTFLEEELKIGYSDLFLLDDKIFYIYIANLASSQESMHLAVSDDEGETFSLVDDNVLDDKGTNDAGMNYRDPKITLLPDGRIRLFTMVQGGSAPIPGSHAAGYIYSHTTEDGLHYNLDEVIRLKPTDFSDFEIWSLNDPQVILLPDGRYKMYVTALIKADNETRKYKEVIVSATTA